MRGPKPFLPLILLLLLTLSSPAQACVGEEIFLYLNVAGHAAVTGVLLVFGILAWGTGRGSMDRCRSVVVVYWLATTVSTALLLISIVAFRQLTLLHGLCMLLPVPLAILFAPPFAPWLHRLAGQPVWSLILIAGLVLLALAFKTDSYGFLKAGLSLLALPGPLILLSILASAPIPPPPPAAPWS